MFKFRLGVALFVSILLIGGATYTRLKSAPTPSPDLVAVTPHADTDTAPSEDLAAGSIATGSTTPQNLNSTDLVTRQLFTDYLSLAATGQATDDNVAALGAQYANSVVDTASPSSINLDSLALVSDSKANFEAYSKAVSNIYNKYHNLAGTTIKGAGSLDSISAPNFVPTMSTLATLYERAATELEAVPTPTSLATSHLALINTYLGNVETLRALTNITRDPIASYGILAKASAQGGDEDNALLGIRGMLLIHGVAFNTGT